MKTCGDTARRQSCMNQEARHRICRYLELGLPAFETLEHLDEKLTIKLSESGLFLSVFWFFSPLFWISPQPGSVCSSSRTYIFETLNSSPCLRKIKVKPQNYKSEMDCADLDPMSTWILTPVMTRLNCNAELYCLNFGHKGIPRARGEVSFTLHVLTEAWGRMTASNQIRVLWPRD